jgi:hypothetical protein
MRFNIASYITVCICYPQVKLLECLLALALHFTVCLLTNCSSVENTTAKRWCMLPKGTYVIGVRHTSVTRDLFFSSMKFSLDNQLRRQAAVARSV